jgi:hypothetical protein
MTIRTNRTHNLACGSPNWFDRNHLLERFIGLTQINSPICQLRNDDGMTEK